MKNSPVLDDLWWCSYFKKVIVPSEFKQSDITKNSKKHKKHQETTTTKNSWFACSTAPTAPTRCFTANQHIGEVPGRGDGGLMILQWTIARTLADPAAGVYRLTTSKRKRWIHFVVPKIHWLIHVKNMWLISTVNIKICISVYMLIC